MSKLRGRRFWRQKRPQAFADWLLSHGFGSLFPRDPHWLGIRGEALAFRELERRGYTIIEKRARWRAGEIDAVAWDGPVLVFVEVKTRSGERFCSPAEAVDWRKQKKIISLAQAYLARKRLGQAPVRFDVVAVEALKNSKPRVTILQSAFEQ